MEKKKTIKDIRTRKKEEIRRAKRRKRAILLIVEFLILFLLLGIGYFIKTYNKMQIQPFEDGELLVNEGVQQKGYTTIALFGGDSRSGVLEAGTHSDTIIIVSINNDTKEIKMASVFRDTFTEQMDGQMKKANNAYFVGGPKEAINMLNKNFDLDIQGYVTVNFTVLADVIDLLGGVKIDVSEAEAAEMNRYVNETARLVGRTAEKVAAGVQVLDGVQAVTYARIRKNVGGDYMRADRQREVLGVVFDKVKQTNISTLNNIINSVLPQVSTSLTTKDIFKLAGGVTKYNLNGSEGFPFSRTDGNVTGAGSVVIPTNLEDNVKQLHLFLFEDDDYQVSSTVKAISDNIEVITGYGSTGQ